MKIPLKISSQEFKLFDSHSRQEIGARTENVSQLMKECEGIKLLRERSTGENVFDAERQANTCFVSGTFKQN